MPSMSDSAQDRNLPASARKIRKARGDGQVARSRDLGHFAALAGGGALLVAFAPELGGWMQQLLADGLRFDRSALDTPGVMVERLASLALRLVFIVIPIGLAMAAVALGAGVASGGWNWTLKPLSPKRRQGGRGTGNSRSIPSWMSNIRPCTKIASGLKRFTIVASPVAT